MGTELLIGMYSLISRHMLQISKFYITDNLYTLGCEMFEISGQLQCRSVDIRCGHHDR